uniref:Putative glycosyltransferase n=1 Tax=Aneurinibacillus thermoaerophilus TaxID=143495 RepID=Q9AGZ0_ANETH|nr:putative glycosyltransferase [Aneurinibacillus thermoaerophilus]
MRVIYTKYNRERLPKFQTETAILDVDDKIIVRKRALLPEGVEHIKNIYRNYELLQKQYNHVHISAASFTDNIITFEYVSKNSFSELLISAINENNHKKFYELLERFYCFLEGLGVYETDEFLSSRDFLTFFGEDISIGTTKCLPISNIDLTFDNVLLDGQENWSIIDYEWVFEFPIPIDYIFFRSVMEFIGKNKEVLIGFVEVSDIFKYFHFSNEILTHFEKMEQRFQDYVFGSKKVFSINDKYLKQQNSLSDLQQKLHNKEEDILNLQQELCSKEEILSNLQQELSNKEVVLSEKNALILRQQESIAKLNKNITELKNTINNKEGHIELLLEQERILHNITNSWEWRLVKKFHRVRDGIFPKGTKRRLLTKLALKTVKNPRVMLGRINSHNLKVFLRHLKTNELTMLENKVQNQINMYSPSEKQGIKLIEQVNVYEKIIFPKYEKPLVSIVIPVYNKWEYTYSCLRSIFEHTQNVSYEIILADDMSSDGTVNASSIVENIKIIRDGVNRGFLLNCNNAAKYAEGKYLLFLNNDTNVQPDWLKHLVDLIERDETIGMVGSKLVYGDGRLQEAGGIIWDDASGWNYGRLDDPEKPEYNYVKEVDYISGASIMIRTSLLE